MSPRSHQARPCLSRSIPATDLERSASPTGDSVKNVRIILAHGAGAGQRHPFIAGVARQLAKAGVDVWTFNFLTWSRSDERPTERLCWKIAFGRSSHLPGSPRAHQTHCSLAGSPWEGESPPTLRLKETR